MNKLLLLTSDTEPNIGVIKCVGSDHTFSPSQVESALGEHFDVDVQVNSIEVLSKHPIKYVVKYSYDMGDEGDAEIEMGTAYLDETWLY